MIRSMTGYGTAQETGVGKRFTVEIKSVNHRYSDVSVKTPRNYSYLEEKVKKCLSGYISRGKVDVYITVENIEGADGEVLLNTPLAKSYYEALKKLCDALSFDSNVRIDHMTRFSDIFTVVKPEEDTDEITAIVLKATEEAAKSFVEMRKAEGARLAENMLAELDIIATYVDEVEKASPRVISEYTSRMRERMSEILGSVPVDEGRLLNEVAVFADKVNVNEEIVRLKSHIKQMRILMNASEPVGKKLDFLIQEMNREVNTTGSKSNDIDIVKRVIDLKACIEKIREQVQNIE
ncbi:MAG: YicC family protein [Clostridia bacterium]|nr:YicC family protein [Clostridia bacterium]